MRRVDARVRFAPGRNHPVAASLRRTAIDEPHLFFSQLPSAPRQVAARQLALEDRILEMIAEPAHGLKDSAEALVVGDVVADQIGGSHMSTPPPRPTLRLESLTGTCWV